jgi:DNA polymerase-3 subunit epsilon
MGVFQGACRASFVDIPAFGYLCSLQVARKTYTLESYRLPVAALAAGFEDFTHHNALADSEACAVIVVHAARRHGAESVEHLATIAGVRLGAIGELAADRADGAELTVTGRRMSVADVTLTQ